MASDRDNHPSVVFARAEAAQIDDRERSARAANCLAHGHPAGETFDTGFGRFCPHCCTFLDPEPAPAPPVEPVDTEETPPKPVAKPRNPVKGAKKST